MEIDVRLKEWALGRQAEYIDAVNTHGSFRKAAKALDVSHQTISSSLLSLKKRAAAKGYAPECDMHKVVPEPFVVRGTSTLYDEFGNQKLQWVKTRLDGQMHELAMRSAIEALSEDIPRVKATRGPEIFADHLLTLYPLTDSHVGLRSWKPETGEDWDLDIAEATLTGAIQGLVRGAPVSETAVICQLGDFLHYDGLSPVTPTSGHILDGDGRYEKVVKVAVRILRNIIDMALEKHNRVVVLMAEGNHDMASSVWLRHLFSLIYEKEPRVEVIESPLPYYAYQHGSTMLAFHHGHLTRNDRLPLLFAAQFPKMWGATERRYCHTGHRHHVEEKEHNGMFVVQHPTLAARDAYASRGGWLADRSISAITYHKEYGQVARLTVVPEMLETT